MAIAHLEGPRRRGCSPAAARRLDAAALQFQRRELPLSAPEMRRLRALAVRAVGRRSPSTLDARLTRYEWVFTAHDGGELQAFLLGQTRMLEGEEHVYFGPMYSVEGAYLALFAAAVRAVAARPVPWWIVAEIERATLRRLFERLVPTSWPRRGVPAPPRIVAGAERLAAALGHVHGFDPELWTTQCEGAPAHLVAVRAGTRAESDGVIRDLDRVLASLRAGARGESSAP